MIAHFPLHPRPRRPDRTTPWARRSRRLALGTTLSIAAVTGLGAVGPSPAYAATYQVTNLDDSGPGSLRRALTDANATTGVADTITFAPGLTGSLPVGRPMEITDPVTIVGPGQDVLTLDADGSADRIFVVDGGDVEADVVISGLTLTGARQGFASGGAIYAGSDSTLALTDVTITGNRAYWGGGIAASGADAVSLTRVTMTDNLSYYSGGALQLLDTATVTITDSLLSGNSQGGAIHTEDSDVTLLRTVLSGNDAGLFTGGAEFTRGDIRIVDSTVTDNHSNTPYGHAGGLYFLDDPTVTITGTLVDGNSTPESGGGIQLYQRQGSMDVVVVNSTILDNVAGVRGGAVYQRSLDGASHLAIDSSTLVGNTAATTDGVATEGFDDASIANSILANGDVDLDRTRTTTPLTASFSLIRRPGGTPFVEPVPGSVLTGLDPRLGGLGDNGGSTRTRLPAAGSPVIDAGSGAGQPTGDARGEPRPADLPAVANPPLAGADGADMGAVEVQPPAPPPEPRPTCAGVEATIVAVAGRPTRGTSARDVIVGTDRADRIDGGGGDDLVCGGRGRDTIRGGTGDDELRGGRGPDTLRGGRGSDALRGGRGDDRLDGGRGDDVLNGGRGSDRLRGGPGRDRLHPG